MVQALSRSDVESAFHEIGETLVRKGRVAEIAVYGGAAIMLQFEVTFRTADMNAKVETGDHGALMEAAHDVAKRRGWLRSWLSEAVTVYLGDQGGTVLHRSYPDEMRAGLRVYVAKPDYLLAMKLRAMRIGSRDESDAIMLATVSKITTFDEMIALIAQYFPKEPSDARRIAIVGQFAERLNAPSPDNAG